MPKVFIIILNWNGYEDLIECLESLRKVDYPEFKIVVIDNGSSDDSIDIIPRQYPDISFIETKKNLGFAGGNNLGITYALKHGADYVLLLNNDTTVEPDFLTKLIEAGESDKKIGIVGPLILFYGDRKKVWFAGGRFNWTKTEGTHIGFKNSILSLSKIKSSPSQKKENELSSWRGTRGDLVKVDYISGCCLLIKREVIEKIGLMSEDYFLYYEDGDWCLRAKKAGLQNILAPVARIYHKGSKSATETSYPYIYYHTRNRLLFCSRFRSVIIAYLISFWLFLKQVVKLFIGYKKNWAKPIIRGVIDFWRGKKGKLAGYY